MAAGDPFRRSVLPNGVRVISYYRAGTPLAAVKLYFKVGSRYDASHPGLAHFQEHVLFNTPPVGQRSTVAQAIEMVGGEANAATTREYTALQAIVLGRDIESAVNGLAALLINGPLDANVVEGERKVILEEIALASDSYQIIWDLFLKALWNGDPFAQPVIGTRESVRILTASELVAHRRDHYVANGVVLAAAGEVDHEALVRTAQTGLGTLPAGPEHSPTPVVSSTTRNAFLEKDTHHTHLVIGVEAAAMGDPQRYPVRLLDIILGHGADSRLHRTLRTDRSLIYSISSTAMSYADRGYFAVYTTCAPENTATVSALILDELNAIRRKGVTAAELQRAQLTYEGALARHFETVLSVANIIGIEELLARVEPFPESIQKIRNVTAEEVQEATTRLLAGDRFAIAAVGRRGDNG